MRYSSLASIWSILVMVFAINILWQAQYAWLMNINARAANVCELTPYATAPQNVMTDLMSVTVPAKGTNSIVGMGLALTLP